MKLYFKCSVVLFFAALQIVFAQEKNVRGVVTDELGAPLPGVTILVKGSSNGTQTDFDGNYNISVPMGKILVFSYVGMKSVEKTVGKESKIDVVLNSDTQELEQVVVVAYGTQNKKSITGSVGVVKADILEKSQTTDVAKALEGSVAGVSISTASGQPGSNSRIRIRGVGSINASNEPLIIVDGSPYDGNLNSINNNDVESVSVLKDASSAALYGSRGANGVVIITTKKGKRGQLKITLDTKVGYNSRGVPEYDLITSPAEFYETMWEAIYNQQIYANGKSADEARLIASGSGTDGLYQTLGHNIYNVANDAIVDPATGRVNPNAKIKYEDPDTFNNWSGLLFSPQLRTEHNLSFSKGTDKGSYYFSLGYLGDNGYNQNTFFERYSSRLNYNGELLPWLKINTNSAVSFTQSNWGVTGNAYANPFGFARSIAPIYPVYEYDANGKFIYENGKKVYDFGLASSTHRARAYGVAYNPVLTQREDIKLNNTYYVNQSVNLDISILKDLSLGIVGNASGQFGGYNAFSTPLAEGERNTGGTLIKERFTDFTFNAIQTLKYKKEIGEYGFEVLLGHENFSRTYNFLDGKKTQALDPKNPEFSNAASLSYLDSYTNKYALEGYFGQINADFDDKYYLSGSLRRDGSSVFAPENRWGTFWSLGASWRLEKEKFLSNIKHLNLLKLKASYGTQGNDYLYLPNSTTYRAWYPYENLYAVETDGQNPVLKAKYKGRREITWEENANLNVGLELGLFDNRVNAGVDYFQRKTNNLLFNLPVSPATGFSTEPWNIGSIVNKGVEFNLEVVPVKNNNVVWSLSANGIHYKNQVLSLPDQFKKEGIINGTKRIIEGGGLYDFYLVKWGGVNPDNGDSQYWIKDASTGEYKIKPSADYSSDSRQNVGSAIPKLAGGFGTSLKVYGFDFNAHFSYQIGGLILDYEYSGIMHAANSILGTNWHTDIRNRWTPDNRYTDIPRVEKTNQSLSQESTRFLTDASYLSVRSLNIGYNVPESALSTVKIKSLKYYISADNVFLLSRRKGLDPRVSTIGINDSALYSAIRTVSVGLLLTL